MTVKIAWILVILGCFSVCGGQTAATRPAETIRAAQLIEQLDDVNSDVRLRATLQLNSLGADALPVVEAALNNGGLSPERQRRLSLAVKILRKRSSYQTWLKSWIDHEAADFRKGYETAGSRSPAWDASALEAVRLFFRLGSKPQEAPPSLRAQALKQFKAAVGAGCDDPVIRVLYCFTQGRPIAAEPAPVPESLMVLWNRVSTRDYPPAVKLRVLAGVAEIEDAAWISDGGRPAELVKALAADGTTPPVETYHLVWMYYKAFQNHRFGRALLDSVMKAYDENAAGKPGPMIVRAVRDMDEAFEWLGPRAQEWNKGFDAQRFWFKEVQRLLEAAWKLDPADPMPATLMITVKLGLGDNRAEMETWFQRAMEANPDNTDACKRKLHYLLPRFHGTDDEMLAFGRECLHTANWRAHLPNLLIVVHEALAQEGGNPKDYFQKPEVWDDIREVYDGANANFPDTMLYHCEYANFAAKAGHWVTADAQFKIIGDKPVLSVFGNRATFEYLRDKSARLAAETPGSPEGH